MSARFQRCAGLLVFALLMTACGSRPVAPPGPAPAVVAPVWQPERDDVEMRIGRVFERPRMTRMTPAEIATHIEFALFGRRDEEGELETYDGHLAQMTRTMRDIDLDHAWNRWVEADAEWWLSQPAETGVRQDVRVQQMLNAVRARYDCDGDGVIRLRELGALLFELAPLVGCEGRWTRRDSLLIHLISLKYCDLDADRRVSPLEEMVVYGVLEDLRRSQGDLERALTCIRGWSGLTDGEIVGICERFRRTGLSASVHPLTFSGTSTSEQCWQEIVRPLICQRWSQGGLPVTAILDQLRDQDIEYIREQVYVRDLAEGRKLAGPDGMAAPARPVRRRLPGLRRTAGGFLTRSGLAPTLDPRCARPATVRLSVLPVSSACWRARPAPRRPRPG